MTVELTDEQIRRKYTAMYGGGQSKLPTHYEGWSKQFTTKHVCRVCGKPASIIEDDGWACDDHRNPEARVNAEPLDGAG